MDIISRQLDDQSSASRLAPPFWLTWLAILVAAAVALTVFQLMRAANESRTVTVLQFAWLIYGLGLASLCLTRIYGRRKARVRGSRVIEQPSAELIETKRLLTAEIEARQHAEARLRQNQLDLSDGENRCRAILETADSAIIVADQHGRIEQFNNAAEGITGYLAAEVIGENMRVLLPPNLRDEHYRYTARYLWTVRELEVCRKEAASSPPNWRSPIGARVDGVISSGCCVI